MHDPNNIIFYILKIAQLQENLCFLHTFVYAGNLKLRRKRRSRVTCIIATYVVPLTVHVSAKARNLLMVAFFPARYARYCHFTFSFRKIKKLDYHKT